MTVMVMVMMMMMMVAMTMIVIMPVVFAALRRERQLTVEIRRYELFHGCVGNPGAHRDAMLRKVGERALANAAGDDHRDALIAQPTGEGAGLVFRRRHHLGASRYLLPGIHLDQREFSATTEVTVQPTVGHRNRDTEGVLFGRGSRD
jgi:hypothetical protein